MAATLELNLLTDDAELVGREIRNQLDTLQVGERNCVVGLPLKWALTAHVQVPKLPEADAASFLQLEAERGFPCESATLHLADSQCQAADGKQHALLVGIPKTHLARLEQVMRAAKLRPVSFSLGLPALQPVGTGTSGVLALAIGEAQVALQITCGGGVAALRALEGVIETEGGSRSLRPEVMVTSP